MSDFGVDLVTVKGALATNGNPAIAERLAETATDVPAPKMVLAITVLPNWVPDGLEPGSNLISKMLVIASPTARLSPIPVTSVGTAEVAV